MLAFCAQATGRPQIETEPAAGATKPMIALNRVDLPLPFMPIRPQMLGRSRVSDTSLSATLPAR